MERTLQAGTERVQRALVAVHRGAHSRHSGPKLSGVWGPAICCGSFHGHPALPPGHKSPTGPLPAAVLGCCPSSWSSSGGVLRGVSSGFTGGWGGGAINRAMEGVMRGILNGPIREGSLAGGIRSFLAGYRWVSRRRSGGFADHCQGGMSCSTGVSIVYSEVFRAPTANP